MTDAEIRSLVARKGDGVIWHSETVMALLERAQQAEYEATEAKNAFRATVKACNELDDRNLQLGIKLEQAADLLAQHTDLCPKKLMRGADDTECDFGEDSDDECNCAEHWRKHLKGGDKA